MRRKKRQKKIKSKYPIVSLIVLAIFVFASVYVAIEVATSGAKLSSLVNEGTKLRRENEKLKTQLVEASSLTSLNQDAEDLGFIKPDLVLYITDEEAVARLP